MRPSRLTLRASQLTFLVLFLVAVGLAAWLSRTYHLSYDWTQNGRNTLSAPSIALLKRLDKPISIVAYATPRPELRRHIRELVARFQEYKPSIRLSFVDPTKEPAQARAHGIQQDGELLVRYGAAEQTVKETREEGITNALMQLGRGGERWVVFLSGHGERSPDRAANFDYSAFADRLRKDGLRVRGLTLSETGQIPQNTALLVIAGPRTAYLPGETKQVEDYVARGGNLLWLLDPGTRMFGLRPLAERLGISRDPGTIVDPISQLLTGNPAALAITRYGASRVTQGLHLTVFPEAAGLKAKPPKGWSETVLFETDARAWSETGPITGTVRFDKGKDIAGPLTVGVALTREQGTRAQRVAVIGDGDFISNSFLGNGANLDLGLNLVNWASSEDAYLNIPARSARDLSFDLDQRAQIALAAFFLAALPLALGLGGFGLWWRRRRR